jgi:hypothetical protein
MTVDSVIESVFEGRAMARVKQFTCLAPAILLLAPMPRLCAQPPNAPLPTTDTLQEQALVTPNSPTAQPSSSDPFPVLPKGKVDLYYLGFENKQAGYDQGAGYELRHSLGTRLWGRPLPWEYNMEYV